METFEDKILKRYSKKNFRTKNSYKNKDAWRWLKKNKFFGLEPITEADFGTLIKEINKAIVFTILKGHSVKLPYNMGTIEIRKRKASAEMRDGKLHITKCVDWKKTLELWKEDKEAYNLKCLVRSDENTVFKIVYLKNKARYKNNRFFKFDPSRLFKLSLKNSINNNEIDSCYEIYTSKDNNE